MAPDVYTPWVLVGGYLDSGKWLDKAEEMCLKQLGNISKAFHLLYLAIYLPIHNYGTHNSGGRLRRLPLLLIP